MEIESFNLEQIRVHTVIVGTGAAGYNAAKTLKGLGPDDILLISEDPDSFDTMAETIENEFKELGVPFRDLLQVIKVLYDGKRCYGILCLDNGNTDDRPHYVAIQAQNVVYATGDSTRDAQSLASAQRKNKNSTDRYKELLSSAVKEMNGIAYRTKAEESNVEDIRTEVTSLMSSIRDRCDLKAFAKRIDSLLEGFNEIVRYADKAELKHVFRLRDLLISQKCYAHSMLDNAEKDENLCHGDKGSCPYDELQVDDGNIR